MFALKSYFYLKKQRKKENKEFFMQKLNILHSITGQQTKCVVDAHWFTESS